MGRHHIKSMALKTGVAAAALLSALPLAAQEEVIMRRPLNLPTNDAGWVTSEFIIYDQFGNPVAPNAACGNLEQRRTVNCVRRGEVVGDSFCRDTPKPIEAFTEFLDAGCTYTWLAGGFQDPGPTCSNAEVQTQVVECRRDLDNVVVNDSLCGGGRPPSTQTVVDHSTCTYSWNPGGFQDPGPACNLAEVWTQTVDCRRDLDNVAVAESFCDAGTRPPETEAREDLSTCTYSWTAAPTFTDPGDSCTDSEIQTRAVWCRRDLDQNVEPDGRCNPAQRPASSQTVEDYSACTYSWVEGAWQDPGPTCNAAERQTRVNTCLRSDGTTVTEGCDPAVEPTREQFVEDLSTCTYSWQYTTWSNWSGTCQTNATRTRTASCVRSDGTTVSDSLCTGTREPLSETSNVYSTCTYSWVEGGWQDPGNSCTTSETQTQTVICRRSNGETVADSFCTGTKPATSRTVEDLSACTYAWTDPAWNDPGASCTSAERQTRTVQCRRSDGQIRPDGECPGPKPAEARDVADFSGCSFSWQTGVWSGWNNTCTANATRTRSVFCQRQDGTNVSDGFCNAGTRPPSSESAAVYSGCGFQWQTNNWRVDPVGQCSPSARFTRDVWCWRTDNTVVSDSSCNAATRPAGETFGPNYDGCQSGVNLTVNWGAWSGYNSSCSDSATRSRTGTCLASGQTVSSNVCTDRGLALTQNESIGIYSGCSYSAAYGAWGTCTGGTRTRSMTSCTNTTLNRSASFSECENRGMPLTQSEGCSVQSSGGFCSSSADGTGAGTFLGGASGTKNSTGATISIGPGNNSSRGENVAPYPLSAVNGSGIYGQAGAISGSTVAQQVQSIRNTCRNMGGTCFEQSEATFSEFGTIINGTINWRCFGGGSTPIYGFFSHSDSGGGADFDVAAQSIIP